MSGLQKLMSMFTSSVDIVSPDLFETVGNSNDLSIPTYDLDTNVTHPDVMFRPLGWNGYKYWMVFTPYPFEARENPSIVASNDGETWVEPAGITNPIEVGFGGSPYNSDVDIVDRIDVEGLVYVFWRWADSVNTRWYYRTSSDGITWGNKTLILTLPDAAASPSFIYRNGQWMVWYVDIRGANTTLYDIKLRRASTIAGLSSASDQIITMSVPVGYHKWHIKVRYDSSLSNYVMVVNYTLAQVGAPNNGGVLSIATSTNGLTWTTRTDLLPLNQQNAYRSTFAITDYSESNGAKYEFFFSKQWKIKRTIIWKKIPSAPVQVFDGITSIDSLYGLKLRLSNWYGLPVARVQRSTDSLLIDVFADGNNLKIADGTLLETWAGVGTLELKRLYNQKGEGDYLFFTNGPLLSKRSDVWDATIWTMTFDGSNDVGESFTATRSANGFTAAISLQSGRFATTKTLSAYFGLDTGTIKLSNGANISVLHNDYPQVLTGIFGTSGSAKIRRDKVDIVTGSTSVNTADVQTVGLGAHWATSVYSSFAACKLSELIVWATTPSNGDLGTVEDQLTTDYPHAQVVVLNDTYTDTNGVLVTNHNADVRPGSNAYSSSDAFWNIQSNKLTRSAAGSGNPVCWIDTGISDGFLEGDLNPASGSAGSGLMFKYQDANNFIYVRLFNNVTLGVIRYVGGALQTPAAATISAPGKPFNLKVEKIGTTIKIYVNGTLQLSYVESNFLTETKVGWFCSTGEPSSTFDNLKFTKW